MQVVQDVQRHQVFIHDSRGVSRRRTVDDSPRSVRVQEYTLYVLKYKKRRIEKVLQTSCAFTKNCASYSVVIRGVVQTSHVGAQGPFSSLPSLPFPLLSPPFPLLSSPVPSPPCPPLPFSLFPSPRTRPPIAAGGLGERISSPSGSGRSPAAERYLVNFRLKFHL